MKIGLYSALARRDVARIRAHIATQGYGSTAEAIRRCRQALMDLDQSHNFGTLLKSPDFFSTSACRDLLFHVHEQCMMLDQIKIFMSDHNLHFLGFEIEAEVQRAYELRFPDDRATTKLDQWQAFEHENPDTFGNMYQFWMQKQG